MLGWTKDSCSWLVLSGDPLEVAVQNQAQDLFNKIGSKLSRLGCGWVDVVFAYLFLADMAHYVKINDIYSAFFAVDPPGRYVYRQPCRLLLPVCTLYYEIGCGTVNFPSFN